jgi:hypothetical protein
MSQTARIGFETVKEILRRTFSSTSAASLHFLHPKMASTGCPEAGAV